jgi:hypothetical protein
MIDWSNLVNLAVGMGLGFSLGRLLASRRLVNPRKPHKMVDSSNPVSITQHISPLLAPQASPFSMDYSQDRSQSQLISDLKAQIKQLTLDYYMAQQMCQFKAGFLARVTHELRSPLNGLIGAHQLILSDLCDSPEEEREFLANANLSAVKMIDMLDKILDVSRTESGKNPIKLESLQLAEVFEEVRYLSEMQAANRNIPLTIVLPDPNIYVLADEQWLTPVLVNLVESAITPEELGRISVSAQVDRDSDNVHILIEAPRPPESWTEAVDLLAEELNRARVRSNVLSNKKGGAAKSQFKTQTGQPPSEFNAQDLNAQDLNAQDPLELNPHVSAGLNLVMTCTILQLMQGRLEILETPADAEDPNLTRIQCSLPLVPPPPELD